MSKLSKIALIVIIISTIFWLGGINVRAIVGYYLLQFGTLDFKPMIHPYVERAVFSLVVQSSIIIDLAYICLWLAGLIFLRTTNLKLKENGWLLMCAILFYMFTPVEIYAMVLDFKMWYLEFIGSEDLVEFRKLFIHRLGALSGVPMIALLSYYTAIVIAVIQPLKKRISDS